MEIINFNKTKRKRKGGNHWLLPDPMRLIMTAPSGSGKSNLLLNLVLQKNWLNWKKLYLICPTSDQPLYDILHEYGDEIGDESIEFINDVDDGPDPDDLDPTFKNLIVYDDVFLDSQKNPAKIFSKGRHKNADCIYLTQKYTQIPKVIRDNSNLLILFNGLDCHGIRGIHQTWCAGDMSLEEFFTFFREAAKETFSFAVIDLTSSVQDGRYRRGFDEFYVQKN